jgi:LmbE family N-acetylglucosaminyl deacetylase
LSVTDGEAAYPDWRDLGKVRRRELSDALRMLAPQIATQHLCIPDGQVRARRADLFNAIDRQLTPTTLIVAPFERDGHPDHDVAGELCCEIARLRGAKVWRYPIWTWHHGTPAQFAGAPLRRFLFDASTRNAKARAISCFASQMRPLGRKPIVPAHVMPYFSRPYEVFLA